MVKKLIYSCFTFMLVIALTGCASNNQQGKNKQTEVTETFSNQDTHQAAENTNLSKKIDIINKDGKKSGEAALTQLKKGVLVQIHVTGLQPGTHGFHIHTVGKCDTPKFESSGAHFNPTDMKHGYNNPSGYHAGDLTNLVANKNGVGEGEFFLDTVTLEKGQPNSLFDEDGSALVIHNETDDYSTDPAGNSGDRVGCGVITE